MTSRPDTPTVLHVVAVVLLACASMALGSCSVTYRAPEAALHQQLHEIDFPGQRPDTVEIYLRNGHVLIQDGEELEGDVQVEVWAGDGRVARERANSVRLDATGEGKTCRLRASHAQGAPLDSMHLRYRLRVPSNVKLRIHTRSAQVAVRGYGGDLEVQSESGEIHARPAGGTCRLTTTSGPIRLGGIYAQAAVTTKTGNIEVRLAPRDQVIELTANSESGPVSIDMAADCRMRLEFTTEEGGLDTDFPVVLHRSGPAVAELQRFVGSVGESDNPERAVASVHCGRAQFEVRRLPRVPADPQ